MPAYALSDNGFGRVPAFINPFLLSNDPADAQSQDDWYFELPSPKTLDTLRVSIDTSISVCEPETAYLDDRNDSTTLTTSETTESPTILDPSAFCYDPKQAQSHQDQYSVISLTPATDEPDVILDPHDPLDALFCEDETIQLTEEHDLGSASVPATNEPAAVLDTSHPFNALFCEPEIVHSTEDHECTNAPLASDSASAAVIDPIHPFDALFCESDDYDFTFPPGSLIGEQPAVSYSFEDLFCEPKATQTQGNNESTPPPVSAFSDTAAVSNSFDDLFCEPQTTQQHDVFGPTDPSSASDTELE
ncbi:hypothetical protein LTS18_007236, partial [Coniosporium uncinatum]